MTETAFTLWILAAMFLGIVMGLILAHLVWIVATDYGVRPFPKIVIRWEVRPHQAQCIRAPSAALQSGPHKAFPDCSVLCE
jgi:hypothetical protein